MVPDTSFLPKGSILRLSVAPQRGNKMGRIGMLAVLVSALIFEEDTMLFGIMLSFGYTQANDRMWYIRNPASTRK